MGESVCACVCVCVCGRVCVYAQVYMLMVITNNTNSKTALIYNPNSYS